ncbi:MAG: MurR/RpiR family transcriptional regulator [Anaerolineae bacterium]
MDRSQSAERQDTIELIYKELPYLNPALRRIGEYIVEHPDEAKTMTINQLAAACGVADSTVTRFVKEIGLKSYQDLKIGIAEALTLSGAADGQADGNYVYEDISRTDSTQTIIDKVLYRNIQALTDTKQRLNVVELNRAVEAIEAANVLIFCCMGSSGLAAEEGVMRFTRAGKKCILFRDQSIQLMTAAIVGPQDVVIGISNSGHSTLVVESLKLAQSNGARTIGITSSEESPLVKYSEISLFTPTKSSALGPGFSWEATTSKSAQILVIDVLYACFAARHFDETLKSLEDTYTAIKDTRG